MEKLSNFKTNFLFSLALLFVFALGFLTAQAQTTAFNFQGRLNDGNNPANGRYDLQFKLFDAITGGNQVGATLARPNLNLINGVFSTQLDFGSSAFSGGDRFIEISLRPTVPVNITPNAFVILGARQQIMSVPYAVKSLNSTNADNATNAVNSTNATNAVNSQQLGGLSASQYIATNANGDVSFSGNVGFQKNVSQAINAYGLAKVLAEVDVDGRILRCFNATLTGTAATTVPCGITVNHFTSGGYGMNFGFPTTNSFISLTIRKGQFFNQSVENGMIRYEAGSGGNINVRTAKPSDDVTTSDYPFMILIF